MTIVALGDICEFVYGKALPKTKREMGPVPVYGSNGVVGTHTDPLSRSETIVIGRKGSVGELNYSSAPCWPIDTTYYVDRSSTTEDIRWLFYALHALRLPELNKATGVPGLNRNDAYERKIFRPAPDEQRRIAAILDKADDIRRKREQEIALADDFLRSVFLGMFGRPKQPNPALKTRLLGETCGLFAGNSLPAGEPYSGQGGGHLLLKVGDLNLPGNDQTVTSAREWLSEKATTGAAIVAPKDAIVFPKRGGAIATNKKRVLGRSCILDPNLMAVAPKPESPLSYPYLRVWFELLDLASISNGSTVPQLNKGDLYPLEMPIPDKETLFAFDQMFHGVNRVRAKHADDLMSAEALFSSLSQRAFRGEL